MEESERRRREQQGPEGSPEERATTRAPKHIARTPQGGQPKEEPTKTYVVKEGQTWGTNPELQAGDTVELTEAEAAGFEDKLEPANAPAPRGLPPQEPPPAPTSPSVPKRTS